MCIKERMHIGQLYVSEIDRRHIFRNLAAEKNGESTDTIIDKYARLTCKYWNLIIRKSPLGQTAPALFPIKIFVVSLWHIKRVLKI